MAAWDPFAGRPDVLGGRYRVHESIGDGGAGVVYRCTDEKTEAEVAVKVVEAPALSRPVRFLAEARDMARLRHPRIVPVLDAGHDGHWYWLVMELMPGGNLKEVVVRDGPMPPAKALRTLYEVLQGLHAVHQAHLIHRDIKPHNVLVDSKGYARLTDFGLARHLAGDVPFRTGTEETLGSPSYRAPEQARDPTAAGREADLYGAGGILFYSLTAKRPHFFYMLEDDEVAEQMAGVPEPLIQIIRKAMAHGPEQRYRTAREMAAVIATAYDQLPSRADETGVAHKWMRDFESGGDSPPGLWDRIHRWWGG